MAYHEMCKDGLRLSSHGESHEHGHLHTETHLGSWTSIRSVGHVGKDDLQRDQPNESLEANIVLSETARMLCTYEILPNQQGMLVDL